MVDMLRIRRILRKPPRVLARRAVQELRAAVEHRRGPWAARRLSGALLLRRLGGVDVDAAWSALAAAPYPIPTDRVDRALYERLCPGDAERIFAAAERGIARRLNLLGSGEFELGWPGRWSTDPKSDTTWAPELVWGCDYAQVGRPSDVKLPWEISRLQWLLPVGQAFLLSGDPRYAEAAREVIDDWIEGNPYAHSVNWAIAMEPAMRIFSLSWLFKVFHATPAWADDRFRERFLQAFYLHGDFVYRYFEESDVNGNHCVADAAALVVAALCMPLSDSSAAWFTKGYGTLLRELPRQVHPDGVDHEASVPYHRLVLELYLLAFRHCIAAGVEVPDEAKERIVAMARFVDAYSRPDGTAPLWGDGDDARALPLGGQVLNDHRYLCGLVAATWPDAICGRADADLSETVWQVGPEPAATMRIAPPSDASVAFRDGGVFILRTSRDHAFFDCGPVGLQGLGGHGHNDCLNVDVVLDAVHVLADPGSYVYTASVEWRNKFRSSFSHNSPIVGGEEQNRILRPDWLWTLGDDAAGTLERWNQGEDYDLVTGSHAGYRRGASPLVTRRTLALHRSEHRVALFDEFDGVDDQDVSIVFQFAPGVRIAELSGGCAVLGGTARGLSISWPSASDWKKQIEDGWFSPSYGLRVPVQRVTLSRVGVGPLLTMIHRDADRGAVAWAAALFSRPGASQRRHASEPMRAPVLDLLSTQLGVGSQ